MLVRIATSEDSKKIALLNHDLDIQHSSYSPMYRLRENASELSAAYITDWIEKSTSGDGLVLVAQEEDIIGFLACSINDYYPHMEIRKIGHIMAVYVVPAYRRRGIATALMKQALKWMKEHKIEYVNLNVDVQNDAAIAAYKAMGFKPNQSNLIQKL